MLVAFVVAMLTTMALIPLLMRASGRLGLLDRPGPRKVHERPMPRVGGLAMAAGVLAPLLALQVLPRPIVGTLAGALVVVAGGVWDDRNPLGHRQKFAVQLIAASIVVFGGGVEIRELVLFAPVSLPQLLAIPSTLLVLVALTNAINLADGLDGLAGGTTFLCCSALALFAYSVGNVPALVLALAATGAILGFLRFNTHPATVFMGDGGSQFLGLLVGSLAIQITQQQDSPVSAAAPLFLLAVPIFDTLLVMVRRIAAGRSPFSADRNHLHHRLLRLGFTHHEAVGLIYYAQSNLFILAYLLRFESDLTNLAVFAGLGFALLAALLGAERAGWRFRERQAAPRESLYAGAKRRIAALPVDRYATFGLKLLLLGYFLGAGFALNVPRDIALLCGGLAAVWMALSIPSVGRALPGFGKAVSYVLSAAVAYLATQGQQMPAWLHQAEGAWVGLIAVATVIALMSMSDGRFRLTSMDLLVLFTAVVVPSLPGAIWGDLNLASLVARLLVLFYAVEVLFSRTEKRPATYGIGVYLALLSLSVHGFV